MTNVTETNLQSDPSPLLGDVEGDIRDIRGPVDIPGGWEWVIWIVCLLAALGLGWLVWSRWIRKELSKAAAITPGVPPHVLALQRLKSAVQWITNPYRFCSEVSDALRNYLEGRFQLKAPDRTTEEFLLEARMSGRLSDAQQALIATFLEQCDLVKFACVQPDRSNLEKLHRTAIEFVEETMNESDVENEKTGLANTA